MPLIRMIYKSLFCYLFLIACIFNTYAQFYTDSLKNWKIATSAYVEAYYVFDFARPENNERASYIFNHRRHNEFNVNHGIIETLIHSEKIRGHIALMIGTYSPAENMLVRIEGRSFSSADKVFILDQNFSQNNFLIASSMAVAF